MLSDFLILYTTAATSSLSVYSPHLQRASFCHFHPAASLFISATLTLISPSVFSLLLFYVTTSSPAGHWSFMLSPCSVFRTSKHVHLSSNPCLPLFCFYHFRVKSRCYYSFFNLPFPPPQICQVRLNLYQPGETHR